MTNLIEKYLGEAMGRGMMKAINVKDTNKLEKILKAKKIKYSKANGKIMVGDDDYDDAEEFAARNNLF